MENEIKELTRELKDLRKEVVYLKDHMHKLVQAVADLNDRGSSGLLGILEDIRDSLRERR